MNGSVSVIIPVRDNERYLGEAIESVLRQSHTPAEVIVVDNGSSDGSRAAAERFGEPVRVLVEPVPGAARARNTGVQAASGDLIAFLDADDLWFESKLAIQIEMLAARPELDMVFTHVQDFVSPELESSPSASVTAQPREYPGLIPSTLLARAGRFRSVGPLPEISAGEFIAWYGRAQTLGLKSSVIPETLVRRRIHLTNTSRRNRVDATGYLKAAKIALDARRERDTRGGT